MALIWHSYDAHMKLMWPNLAVWTFIWHSYDATWPHIVVVLVVLFSSFPTTRLMMRPGAPKLDVLI
eukprot:736577-Karenia_brevis.AAC.1